MSTRPRASLERVALTRVMAAAYTEQTDLVRALENDQGEEEIRELRPKFRQVGRRLLDQVFEREGVEIIAAPADSPLCMHTAVAGKGTNTIQTSGPWFCRSHSQATPSPPSHSVLSNTMPGPSVFAWLQGPVRKSSCFASCKCMNLLPRLVLSLTWQPCVGASHSKIREPDPAKVTDSKPKAHRYTSWFRS